MLVCNVGEISELNDCLPLVEVPVWHRHVETITSTEWMAVYALIKSRHGQKTASACLNRASIECTKEFILSDMEPPALMSFRPPVERMTADDLIQYLEHFSLMEQAAITVAILEQMNITDVVALTWKQIGRMNLTEESQLAIEGLPRHIKSPYVFFEHEIGEQPTALTRMRQRVFKKTGMSWSEFSKSAVKALS